MTETTPLSGVGSKVIYRPAPVDDAKSARAFRIHLDTKTGVPRRHVQLPIGVIGVLKKFEENAARRVSELPDLAADGRQQLGRKLVIR